MLLLNANLFAQHRGLKLGLYRFLPSILLKPFKNFINLNEITKQFADVLRRVMADIKMSYGDVEAASTNNWAN